jgi:hypothetical protein
MSKVLTIAQREIRERSFVFLAAAALAVAPFLAVLVPSGNFDDRMRATTWLGLILAAAFVIGLGILLGVSLIGRESREKRLSFYFARPVGGSAIWFGKLIAAAALLIGSGAIIFAPGVVLVPAEWRGIWDLSVWSLIGVVLTLAGSFVLVFHTAATMIRSRSLLLAFDFIAAVVFLTGLWTVLLPIVIQRPGLRLAAVMTAVLGGAICAALVFGGAWQLSRGRIDPRRSHRELSIAVWCALAVVLAGSAAGAHWFTSVTPEDLTTQFVTVREDVSGSAVVVAGQARHRFDFTSCFLFNTGNGSWVRVPPSLAYGGLVNRAGTVAVWVKPPQPIVALLDLTRRRDSGEIDLQVSRLRGSTWETRDSGISVAVSRGASFAMQLSPAGDRLAVLSADTLTIFNLADRRSVGSVRLPLCGWIRMRFIDPDAIVVTAVPWATHVLATRSVAAPADVVAYRYDAGARTLRQLLDVPIPGDTSGRATVSGDGRRLALRLFASSPAEVPRLRLFDLTTGAEKGSISAAGPKGFGTWMLTDGTIAATQSRADQVALELYSLDGGLLRTINFGREGSPRLQGELPDGRLLISVVRTSLQHVKGAHGWNVDVVDPRSGAVSRLTDNLMLVPAESWYGWYAGDPGAHTIFAGFDSGGLVAWNALTGQRRLLIASR